MIQSRSRPCYLILILSICLSLNYQGYAQSAKLTTALDSLLTKEHKQGDLNGSVLVIKDGATFFEKSYGYTDGTKNRELSANYRFNLGSIFKEFPGVAIMQLQEKGNLKLNDPVSKYLKNLPEWAKEVTIKNLLQYTSGLPNAPWGELFKNNSPVEESHLLKELNSIENLEFEPGTNYLYSTYNPILLIKIVEAISGKKFSEYAQKHLFSPATMMHTVFKPEYPYKDRTDIAIPFDSEFQEDQYHIAINFVLLVSTPRDVYNWFNSLENYKLISKKSLKVLSEEYPDLPKINTQSPLGHLNWNSGNIAAHIHHGNTNNYECVVKSFPEQKLTVVILTNREAGDIDELAEKILKKIL
ncbi:serine hydrolase domain-containing protein [Zunongwangia sp. HRR-M8]|uniref:serine hydrolase domain-containing protein n=1 Tax=Zunongwangia sp. HRR-M8 TaxID=3015170 RepID=UPI0022DCF3EB|nr:serine hydrolase domain-containing protein [Zunongwangia sp. HRR-M8]WBL22305.1 serine hydrolase [Zunongwangia sp. HRR-M8]